MDMVVIAGSSVCNVSAREFRHAFEAPYAPQVAVPLTAEPDDVRRIHPLVFRSSGIAALT